jgi:hypothetical protein
MLRMTTALLLICFVAESRAQDNARMATGKHSLIATFDETDARRNFFHDVNVCSEAERLTLVVLSDLAEKQDETEEADEDASKHARGGFGDPSDDGRAKWLARPLGQEPWLSPERKVHGTVDAEGVIRFGVTTTRDGRLVSLHFVGRSSFTGASGKVFLLSSEEPVLEGTWKLINPFTNARLVPGFNGAGPFGR